MTTTRQACGEPCRFFSLEQGDDARRACFRGARGGSCYERCRGGNGCDAIVGRSADALLRFFRFLMFHSFGAGSTRARRSLLTWPARPSTEEDECRYGMHAMLVGGNVVQERLDPRLDDIQRKCILGLWLVAWFFMLS